MLKSAISPNVYTHTLVNLHHMDSGAASDKDKFITIMQNPDSMQNS